MIVPRAPAPRPAATLLLATALAGCGGPATPPAGTRQATATAEEPGDLPEILAALSRSHGDLRAVVGPHRLRYELTIEMKPDEPAPDPAPAGAGHARPQSITDRVTISWAPGVLDFVHGNDGDRGRWLRVIGERVYTRLPHRPWHVRELETDAHELWLDEAARGPADALAFVGPALELGALEADGELRTFGLGLRDSPEAPSPTEGPGAWRAALRFSKIEGELVLHGPSGTWRSLELVAEFSRPGRGDEPALSGSLRVSGTLEPVDAAQIVVEPPEGATPLPERRRLEPVRRALLEGLAAPGTRG